MILQLPSLSKIDRRGQTRSKYAEVHKRKQIKKEQEQEQDAPSLHATQQKREGKSLQRYRLM